jgi:uncharacterized membrane protein
MSEVVEIKKAPRPRLMFIDMARSIAILLMLEGHFIGLTLDNAYRDDENLLYMTWNFVRGFTAPMFFTVTGVVFVYLLTNNSAAGFFKNRRVTKGFKRSIELVFWGYLLQTNFQHFPDYLRGNISDWFFAFHVLQSIGVGISFLLIIYGIYKLIGKLPLGLYYFVAATTLFSFYPYLKGLPDGVYPMEGWPLFLQNMVRGPYSVFPIVPWVAFTLYGGMVGALLNRYYKYVKRFWFPLTFMILGLILNIFGFYIFTGIDELFKLLKIDENPDFVKNAWLYGRIGQVLIALGILMFIEKYFRVKESLFIRVGQNTLQIYIVHVIVLYSAIFGVGINQWYNRNLDPYWAIGSAALFIATFILFVKYLDPITKVYKKLWSFVYWPFIQLFKLVKPN